MVEEIDLQNIRMLLIKTKGPNFFELTVALQKALNVTIWFKWKANMSVDATIPEM